MLLCECKRILCVFLRKIINIEHAPHFIKTGTYLPFQSLPFSNDLLYETAGAFILFTPSFYAVIR